MRELFVPATPVGKSEKYRRVWEAQSELFVRWAFSENVDGGRERLRRFVAAAATQTAITATPNPATEGGKRATIFVVPVDRFEQI